MVSPPSDSSNVAQRTLGRRSSEQPRDEKISPTNGSGPRNGSREGGEGERDEGEGEDRRVREPCLREKESWRRLRSRRMVLLPWTSYPSSSSSSSSSSCTLSDSIYIWCTCNMYMYMYIYICICILRLDKMSQSDKQTCKCDNHSLTLSSHIYTFALSLKYTLRPQKW